MLHSLGTDCIVWEYEDLREHSVGCFKLRLLCYCSNILKFKLGLHKFCPIKLLIRKLSRILMQVAPLWMREFGPLYLNVLSTGRPLYLLINVLDIYVTNKRVIWSSLQIDILTVKDSDKDLEAHTKWHSVCLPDISGALICLFLMYLWRGRAGHFWHTELSFNSTVEEPFQMGPHAVTIWLFKNCIISFFVCNFISWHVV